MGLEDRDYYKNDRGGSYSRPLFRPRAMSVTTWLIIINVAVFFLDLALPMIDIADVRGHLSTASPDQIARAVEPDLPRPANIVSGQTWQRPLVDPATGEQIGFTNYRTWHMLNGIGHFSLLHGFLRMEVWRLVTFQFLHADISHLFFNMFGLFVFGGMVEEFLGRRRYLAFYLICGIGGALLYLFFSLLAFVGVPLPGTLAMNTWGTPLIGASAGVFGVIVACARVDPGRQIQLLFPPIPLKMAWLAYGYVGIAAFNLIRGGQNAGGDAAHIGGAVAGFFFIKNAHLLRDFLDIGIGRRSGAKRPGQHRPGPPPSDTELDRILAKVHEKGIHSLTAKEKRMLERTSRERRDSA